MTEKGNFFFPDIVSETNISAKTHNPFSGMWYKTKICCFSLLTNLIPFFFTALDTFPMMHSDAPV